MTTISLPPTRNVGLTHPSRIVLTPGRLLASLQHGARQMPNKALLIEAESGKELSYSQALAGLALLRQLFGPPPQRIMLALPGSLLSGLIWLTALSSGYDLIPVPPEASADEARRLLARQRPSLLCAADEGESAWSAQLLPSTVRLFTASQLTALISHAPEPARPLAIREGRVYLSTSGSTGEPKWLALSERQIAWTAEQVRSSHALTDADRGLTTLPFFHINAPVVSLCASLLAGASLIVAPRFSRRRFWSWVERYEATWISVVPTIVALLLESEGCPAFLPGRLRFARSASAPLPPANLRAFEERFGIPLIETYGLSEAGSQVAANPLPPAPHKAGSVGRPTGVAMRICLPRGDARSQSQGDEELQDLPPGEVGEICIAGPNVIRAYQDGAGASSFQNGWFRTGDLGYFDEDGYLFIKGRLREVINRGGENIAPREIEETLQEHPAVREVAVVGRPDPLYGEVVVAYLSLQEGRQLSVEELRSYARQRLSPPRVPVDYLILPELPRNATGKIDRRLLRTREQARRELQQIAREEVRS
ncbi:MAG: AMP-binding protein [Thermogemmatispora sp.]|jgi:acyl-CoA synthetase (AMP-forming)/AMP-acid ligase II|uniref:AMP-binding protein n=1 Tax=Thermogemmatispora TaxID=768669 RepID=UPI00124EE784|nr:MULTISPECIES: AMP-binding protein [Thermogemmatispora]MBE3565940.1 AMP-binding protein [Thermogemmatispora sp.]